MSITGNLRTLELAELLQWLAQGRKTGALVVENSQVEKRIYFRAGKIICSESNNSNEHLGSFLIRQGLIDEATLSRAVKLQESTQILLGRVLVNLGSISEEELNRILLLKTQESIYDLFSWEEGEFHFVPDELPKQSMMALQLDVTNVVLEGAKRLDEARHDAQEAVEFQATQALDVGSEPLAAGLALDGEHIEVDPIDEELEEASWEVEPPADSRPDEELFIDREPTGEVRGYYHAGHGKKPSRTPMFAAAAALAILVVGALVYFVFLRPEPAVGIADRATLKPAPIPTLAALQSDPDDFSSPLQLDLDHLALEESVAPPAQETAKPAPASTPKPEVPARADQSEEMRSRYEAEVAALKKQLQEAKLVAAKRQAAVQLLKADDRPSDPQLVKLAPVQTLEEDADPRASSELTRDGEVTAGGDEPPSLAGTVAAREDPADSGAELTDEIVEVTAEPTVALEADPTPPGAQDVVEVESAVTPPVLLANPQPRYPSAALRLGKQAEVTVRLLIDERGNVAEVERVGRMAGMGFDQAALLAARRTSWKPGTRDGAPTKMWTELRISFRP